MLFQGSVMCNVRRHWIIVLNAVQAVHCWSMSWTSGWEQKGFSADWPTLPLQLSSPSYCSLYDDQMLMTGMYQSGGGGLVWPSCKLLLITHDSSLPLVSIKTLLHYVELPPSLDVTSDFQLSSLPFACLYQGFHAPQPYHEQFWMYLDSPWSWWNEMYKGPSVMHAQLSEARQLFENSPNSW